MSARSAGPPSSARRTRNRSPCVPCSGRGRANRARVAAAAPRARSPARRDSRDRAAWPPCRRPRRPRRRASCRAGEAPDPDAHEQLRVSARDQQQQVGKRDIVGQPRGQRMRLEVVDRDVTACRRPRRCPLPAIVPTIKPPISPGPAEAAIPSTSPSPDPASSSARRTSPSTWSRCARAAISGTTPP